MASNKKNGSDFEREFCVLAHDNGFWAHMMAPNTAGQPADVILCKNDTPALIDCKDCKGNTFSFDRIEENQWYAMQKWRQKGNDIAYFALKIDDEIWMMSFEIISFLVSSGFKQCNLSKIKKHGITFDEWAVAFNEDNCQ